MGYLPVMPKNTVSLKNVCNQHPDQCCTTRNLFNKSTVDLQQLLCENIKVLRNNDELTSVIPLCKSSGATSYYTGKLNCDGVENKSIVNGLLELIKFGLLDWCGCLADHDTSSGKDEHSKDASDFANLIQNYTSDSSCDANVDYYNDFSNDLHIVSNEKEKESDNKMGFLLKLASLKFCGDDTFNNLLKMDRYTNSKDGASYDYSQTLATYFGNKSVDERNLFNSCRYYDPCKRMKIKKNILKANDDLKSSVIRLCGCSLNKEELLQTISDYIVRDSENKFSGLNNIINAKININFCRQNNGIESVVMYDANIRIDLGVYISLASICKDKDSVTKVLKYIFNNPNNTVLSSISESLLVDLQTDYPGCYPCGFQKTTVSALGREVYKNVLNKEVKASTTEGGDDNKIASHLTSVSSHNAFLNCFKSGRVILNNGKVCKTC